MTVDKRSALASTLLIIALSASSGCDSGEEDQNQFDDVGPGTLVAEARSFAWSSSGDRLYFTTDAPVGSDEGRYRIYEAPIGGSPQLLYEGQTEAYDVAQCALVRHLEEVDGHLYFDTDFYVDRGTFGNIYRLSLRVNEEPVAVVEDAALPTGNPITPSFDISADGRRIAYFSQSEDAVWATTRSLETGELISSVGGASRFDARLRVFLSDDGARLLHNADFDLPSTSPEDSYSVVDLTTGTAQSVRLRLSEDIEGRPRTNSYSIYAEDGDFVAVYAAGAGAFSGPFPLVTQRLPGGTPEVMASIAKSADGLTDTFLFPDASDSYYAFWREAPNLGAGPRALHVIDLEDGTERRIAGPIPVSVAPCTTSLRIDPGGSQIAYLGVASEGADVGLYIAPLQP